MSNGGKEIWESNLSDKNSIIKECFDENNIYGSHMQTARKDVFLYQVDTTKTCIDEFYTWKDMLAGTSCEAEVWRPFFWIGSQMYGETDEWGWEDELKTLKLGRFGSIDTLWKVLRHPTIL